jgi:very-long-chain (3R)-3-hydroxyacyl-CoA dehydratase
MILDVVHVVCKLVPGDPIATVLQVISRLYAVWVVLPSQPAVAKWNYILFTAWSLAEIIRYQYYLYREVSFLQFLRYNAFIVLYPLGVLTGEIPLIWEHYQNLKFRFDIFVLLLYLPGFPFLYFHMLKLRRRRQKIKTN